MISRGDDSEAYRYLLKTVNEKVLDVARDFLSGAFRPTMPGLSDAAVARRCKIVLRNGGLTPAFVMIDGANAERIAIESVFPGVPLRACQFHVMQACRQRMREIFRTSINPNKATEAALDAIAACQRCPHPSEWSAKFKELESTVTGLAEGDASVWPRVKEYLERFWFSPKWRQYTCDYGLPPGVSRDGPWSTNNYVEAAFRTFDRVFLNCQVNRRSVSRFPPPTRLGGARIAADRSRSDRLATILIVQFFPFYEFGPPIHLRVDEQLFRNTSDGLQRWEDDCITPCRLIDVPLAEQKRFGPSTIYQVDPRMSGQPSKPFRSHYCGREPAAQRETCTCRYAERTGKRCAHLWAMVCYELNGPVLEADCQIAQDLVSLRSEPFKQDTLHHEASDRVPDTGSLEYTDPASAFTAFWGTDHPRIAGAAEESLDHLFPRRPQSSIGYVTVEVEHSRPVPATPSTPESPSLRSKIAVTQDDEDNDDGWHPVGRRHAPARDHDTETDGEEASSAHSAADLTRTTTAKSASGRPAKQRPLHPHRRSQPRNLLRHTSAERAIGGATSVATFVQKLVAVDPASTGRRSTLTTTAPGPAPRGIRNPGNDCFIIALLQAFLRVAHWRRLSTDGGWAASGGPVASMIAGLLDGIRAGSDLDGWHLRNVLLGE